MNRTSCSWISLLALSVLLTLQATAAPQTLNPNSGFEEPLQGERLVGWQQGKHYGVIPKGSQVLLDEAEAHANRQSLKVVSPADDVPVLVESDPVNLDPAKTYVFSVFLKAAAEDTPVRLFVLSTDYKRVQSRADTVGTEWKQYIVVLGAKGNGPAMPYRARFDLMGKGTLWADEATLTEFDPETFTPSEYIGYRRATGPGNETVTLRVGAPDGKRLPEINGIGFSYGFGQRKLDSRFAELGVKVVRVHNVLTNFRIIRRDENFQLQYNFEQLDQLLDEVLQIGGVPEMNLCFVPLQMVYNPDINKIRNSYDGFYLGPPTNFKEWEGFISEIVAHCRDHYDISRWYWVFGNEPSVQKLFSMGSADDFYRLYESTLAGATAAYPEIVIGAGSFASRAWMKDFMARCGRDKTRLDIVTWHHYNLVPEDYGKYIEETRRWIAEFGLRKDMKLAIDEWNPWLPDGGQYELSAGNYAAGQMAASIASMMQAGLDYHTFFIAHSPIPFGMIGPKNVKHPTFNAMKLFSMLGSEALPLEVPAGEPYVGGLAAPRADGTQTVLIWYTKHHFDLSKDMEKTVTVDLGTSPGTPAFELHAIDTEHSNGYRDPKRQELEMRTDFRYQRTPEGRHELSFAAGPDSLFLLIAKPGQD